MKFLHPCLSTLLLWAASSSVVVGRIRSSDSTSTDVEELSTSDNRSDRVLAADDDDEYLYDPYQVTIKTTTDCTTATGTVKVSVKDPNTGIPIRYNQVEFSLAGQGDALYTFNTKTNWNGVARYTFEAAAEDYNKPLTCSVSVKDPNVLEYGWQDDIPCKIRVSFCKT